MADTKITALTALADTPADGDFYPIVDVSDTTMAASGTTKKIAASRILHTNGTANKIASLSIVGTANSFTLGDGANSSTYFNMAGARSQIGYDAAAGNVVIQGGTGKGIKMMINSATFAAGTAALTVGSGGTVTIGTAVISTLGGAMSAAGYAITGLGSATITGSAGTVEFPATGNIIYFTRPAINYIWATATGGEYALGVNGASASAANSTIYLKSDKNVGISTSTPSYLLDVNGAAHASSFPVSSDMRLKENIRPFVLTPAIKQKLNQINAYLFEWRDNYSAVDQFRRGDGVTKDTQLGFIAQEVGSAVPQLVTRWRHAKAHADPDTGETIEENVLIDAMAVDYSRFVPILWEAAKELYSEVATLKQRVTALGG